LTYPLPQGRVRDLSFPWINYTSALAADMVCFNSEFHRRVFLEALPGLVGRYHDHQELDLIASIAAKSHVLPPGIELARLDGAGGTGLGLRARFRGLSRAAMASRYCGEQRHPRVFWD